ncbi:ExeM/NucH family extracellular endonuclease [Aquabacterium sp.]|uniref:ExeM/NucH family extracellular endonuclease n=1 Tax=Aquabacterium sp. TaxID=1872578 RepID=UPI002E309ED6|nr:ExeM/NucH family extracellular endonuclease [Aquabacterium sp.]HEX5312904.1 ExeM/NucH family extracellular endonuclease [Aquabacterium sp.]
MSRCFSTPRSLTPFATAMALAMASMCAQASSTGVVISQVYGGGGNAGATYKNDFVELFNAGAAAVNLSGWSVQYASATGTSWQVTNLSNTVLQPGQYYLIQQAAGTGGTAALPTPDAIGTIAMSGTAGKVALVRSTTALSGTGVSAASVEDFVGFGATASAYEGSGATPAPSNTVAVMRGLNGCTDTNNNASDFNTAAPTPRNGASPAGTCTAAPAPATVSIFDIQGSGHTSPYAGQTVSTRGVVTRLNNNGFFLQDPVGDGLPQTSDGVFVFTGTAPTVSVGQLIQLTGNVVEFNTGAASNALTAARTVTEISGVSNVTVLGAGYAIAPTVITLPATAAELERVEGMLVTINTQLTASQNYFQGRYGQVTLSAGGRLEKPTNAFRPGSSDAVALTEANAQRQILLDDGNSLQNPNPTPYIGADNTLRAGDTLDSLTGVIDYGLATSDNTGAGSYKIHPTTAVNFTRVNQRTSAPLPVGGNVRVASANLLNYFTTFGDGKTASGKSGQGCAPSGTTSDCRGADSAAEFTRQRNKLVAELKALNADVVGLMELQNNGEAIANLVAGLNEQMGAGTYATIADPSTGVGTDAIKVGLIYKPAALTPVGPSVSDTDPSHKRPSVAQTFAAANGETFNVVVNHFKSKGCSGAAGADVDQGDGQGCFNAARVAEAQALRSFVADLQTRSGSARTLLLGDFNAYGMEDPVYEFTSNGYVDLAKRFNALDYSYVFDGEAGSLDHAIATPEANTLVTGAQVWHVNADEPSIIDYNLEFKQPACATCGPDYYSATPYRSSDHDPIVIGLSLLKTLNGSTGRDTIMGTSGDDVITGGEQSDTLTGGAGRDVFVYQSIRDGLDTITDFTPGTDRIDLTTLLASIGVNPATALSQGYIRLVSTNTGTQVQVDTDGSAGSTLPRALVLLKGVAVNQIVPGRDLGL